MVHRGLVAGFFFVKFDFGIDVVMYAKPAWFLAPSLPFQREAFKMAVSSSVVNGRGFPFMLQTCDCNRELQRQFHRTESCSAPTWMTWLTFR